MNISSEQQEIMDKMLADQNARKNRSLEKAKISVVKERTVPVEPGVIRVERIVNPEDLKPSPYRTTTEDVVANSDEEDRKFEKRKLEMGK